uniref:Uncharacterized protein n=1 Tax=Anguilla anguilla TaxID=7936 RepID=A0A0E9VWD9_ANGAN
MMSKILLYCCTAYCLATASDAHTSLQRSHEPSFMKHVQMSRSFCF